VIADDHALLRQGLIVLMRDAHPDWTFGEAASFDEALEQLAMEPVELLLIDLHMPGMEGSRTLQALREVYPQSRIAVLTGTEDRATILDCLGAGVHGYILKSDAAETMLGAIETLLVGGVYVPPMITRIAGAAGKALLPAAAASPPGGGVAAAAGAAASPGAMALTPVAAAAQPASGTASGAVPAAGAAGPGSMGKPAGLTPRQIDVLKLLAEGRSTKDIARGLNLGLGTVKVHLAGVYRALGASNRMEAVVRAGRLKLDD
jgi:DNA-binding NarL/FixJ family response regulator